MQHHDLPLTVREQAQHLIKHHMIFRLPISVVRILHMKQLIKRYILIFRLAQAHKRQIARDRQQPRHRLARRLIARCRLHHAHERILHHVLSRRRIAQDRQGETVNGRGRLAIQHLERGGVPLRNAQDQAVIRWSRIGRTYIACAFVVILHIRLPHMSIMPENKF